MGAKLEFIEDDLEGKEIIALLELHLGEMRAWLPACSVHAMPVERLRQVDVTFWSVWESDRLAGCGALKQLDCRHGEIKSMRAHPDYRGKGIGLAVLMYLIETARLRRYSRLSLETGASGQFEPARRLYAANGFAECGPFGDYQEDPFSVFMTRQI